MRKIIELGETLRLYIDYVDIDTGAAVDPSILSCVVRRPDGTTDTIPYPDTDFVREAPGAFFVRILGDQIGTWYYRITAQTSITDIDVRDGKFDVEPSL